MASENAGFFCDLLLVRPSKLPKPSKQGFDEKRTLLDSTQVINLVMPH